jgi:signal transduction histidine kinase
MEWEGKHVNQRIAHIIRFAGFFIPVILTLYGVLIQIGGAYGGYYVSDVVFYLICIPWIGVGTYQFVVSANSQFRSAVQLIIYHIFTVAYILFVAGFAMPFISIWMVLLLASFVYFGDSGYRLSMLTFFGTAMADILLHLDSSEHILTNIVTLVAVFVIGVIAVALSQAQAVDRDELNRSKSEESLQRDRILTIVNNLADAILSTDKNGVIQIYNAASLNLLDTNSGLMGQPIDGVIQLVDSDGKPFKLSKNLKAAKGVVNREDLSAVISGEQLHLSVIFSPIRGTDSHSDKNDDGYILILRDITKQKSLEEERDEFISVVSHELRTPITVAEGSLSNIMLMMSRPDIAQERIADSMTSAHDEIVYLAKMVNDLSTLSRAERGVADAAEQMDVDSVIHEIYNEYAPEAEKKGLHLNLDLEPQLGEIYASRLYFKELVQNFVTNAIKYTKEGSVTIEVKKVGKKIHFNVIDTGIGISKSDQKRVFEKFFRSEDYRTRETGGTGLGLYVAVKLSKKLGTVIEMTSRLNHGSTFGFSLPQAKKK